MWPDKLKLLHVPSVPGRRDSIGPLRESVSHKVKTKTGWATVPRLASDIFGGTCFKPYHARLTKRTRWL
ncbi:unnamed protein product [Chondrus crispus]|uniref:Uncharacterized protein n=1 Tax=Chondrus crispus TaxID=2769 RepID=R7QS27_CHOCR|nr:unnamed protein product [Chondrus crispus]CDF40190.1 unnamed protein product [Chondrus crispus]|eukprot:XP_005710484.1 unnamed protein product [Chondrus crispus]